jgi:hypothetical protein
MVQGKSFFVRKFLPYRIKSYLCFGLLVLEGLLSVKHKKGNGVVDLMCFWFTFYVCGEFWREHNHVFLYMGKVGAKCFFYFMSGGWSCKK